MSSDRLMLQRLKAKVTRGVLRAPFYDVNNWVNDFDLQARMLWDVHVSTGRYDIPFDLI